MNPEFQRNLWLELPPHRIASQPAVLVLVFLASSLAAGVDSFPVVAEVLLALLLVLWGSRLAAESVIGEMIARTWDGQRMSAITPWQMTWGKLFGSTAYVWYGAFWCLIAFAFGGGKDFYGLARVLLCGLEAQILALMLGLILIQTKAPSHRLMISAAQVIAVLTVGGVLIGLEYLGASKVVWFGMSIEASPFIAVSMFIMVMWSLLGLYEMMRAELQYTVRTMWWFLFAAFGALFAAGFDELRSIVVAIRLPGPAVERLFIAYLAAVFLTYLCAFLEPKESSRLQRWLKARERRDYIHSVAWAPVWFGGAALVLLLGFLLAVNIIVLGNGGRGLVLQISLVAAVPIFMFRDITVLYYLTLEGNPHRAHFSAMIFLVCAYFIVPVSLSAAGLEVILPILIPSPATPELAVLPALMQLLLALSLMNQRWKGVMLDKLDQPTGPIGR